MGWTKLKVTANDNAGAGVLYVRMANGDLSHAAQTATEFAALAFLEGFSNSDGHVLPDRSEQGAHIAMPFRPECMECMCSTCSNHYVWLIAS